jgi:predicted cupin superfamily sugar epimerase
MVVNLVETKISTLNLEPHPEGGYYRQTFRSAQKLESGRPAATSILFLLTHDNPSNFHRLDAEEIWYFHEGDPLSVHIIDEEGTYSEILIGPNAVVGEVLQAVVPPGVWFGSSVRAPTDEGLGWSLVGCMVSPGFDFTGFELADRKAMLARYPHCDGIIKTLTRAAL